jgi:hypothetical protein
MGLLDIILNEGKKYLRDAAPGGLLNPEVPPGGPTEVAKSLLSFTPGVGDAISAYDAVQSARNGDWTGAALNGIGVLPFIPSIAGMVSPIKKSAKEAYLANKELFDNAHKSANLSFTALPISDTKDAVSIYKSPKYGTKPSSEYMVGIVNGEPVYIRKSDHWGQFFTNIYAGSPEAKARGLLAEEGDQFGRVGYKEHNWNLQGGISSKSADRIAELQAARAALPENEKFGDAGSKLWDELYALLRPGKREAGYIPLSKLRE